MAGTLLLEQRLEPRERPVGLALWHPADEHAGCRRAEEPARGLELVLVLEMGDAVAVGELVGGARVGVGGPAALPGGRGVGLVLRELPFHLEVGAAQTQRLLH